MNERLSALLGQMNNTPADVSPAAHEDSDAGHVGLERVLQRSLRRAYAINGVELVRRQMKRGSQAYSERDADTVVAIMELLDRLAE